MKPSAQGVALGLGLAAFAAFQQFKLPVVLPAMLAEFGYPRTLAGGFMSVYAVAGLALSIAVGHTVERRGAGRPIALALAAMAAGIALVLGAPGHGWLVLAGRGLEGAGFAALAVSGSVLATTNATPAKRALVTGMLAGWIPFGQLSAAAIAPPLVALGGWRLVWWAALALTLVVGCWTLLLVRRGWVLLRPAGKPGSGAAAAGQLDPGQRRPRHPRPQTKPRGPHAAPQIQRALPGPGRHRGGQQNRLDPGAIAVARLPQRQLSAKKGVTCQRHQPGTGISLSRNTSVARKWTLSRTIRRRGNTPMDPSSTLRWTSI